MDNAYTGRYYFEAFERLHSPFQKLVASPITLKLRLHVELKGFSGAGVVNLHRMVDHEIDRHQRFNHLHILAEPGNGRAHRRQIHEQRHPGEVLQHDSGDHEWNFFGTNGIRLPVREATNISLANLLAVEISEHRLQNNANAYWKSRNVSDTLSFEVWQRIEPSFTPRSGLKFLQCIEKLM